MLGAMQSVKTSSSLALDDSTNMSAIFVFLLAVAVALFPFRAWAVNGSVSSNLTEPQVLELFFQRNLSLIAARYDIDQARADQIVAAAIPNPVLTFSVYELSNHMFGKQGNGNLPALSPQIQQLIETAGKRRLRMETSELGTEAVELDFQDTVRVLTNAVRKSVYALLLAQKTAAVADDNWRRYQDILRANERRLKAGDIAETDYLRIEVESLKAKADQDLAETSLRQARADLLLLLGWSENAAQITVADAWPANVEWASVQAADRLRRALDERPDLRAARIRIKQAQGNVTLARRLAIPDVTIGGFYQRDPGNFYANTGGVSISLPLPLFYRQEGEISKAEVSLGSAELFLRQSEQTVRTEVARASAAWDSADAIVRRFEDIVLARIDKLRKAQEFAYARGAVGLLDLIDAERNYKAMMLDYYNALANRSNAYADLLMALGIQGQSQ